MLALAVWGAAAVLYAAPQKLPPTSGRYGIVQTQRIRFRNAPLFQKAADAVAKEDYAAADRLFNEILRNDPGNNSAKLSLITVYDRLGRQEAALRLCDELIRQYPDFSDTYLTKGYLAMKTGQDGLAIEAWEKGLRNAPKDFPRRREILLNLGQTYARDRRYAEAKNAYDQALAASFDPSTALAYFYILKNMRQEEQGRETLERVLAGTAPTSIKLTAAYELAQLDRRAGRTDEFFRRMEILLRDETDAARLYEGALQSYAAGNHDLTLRILSKAFELESDLNKKFEIGLFAAEVFLQQKRPAEARTWLGKLKVPAGADRHWTLVMARADYLEGNYRAAAQRLESLKNRTAPADLLLGFAFMKSGMAGPALEVLDEIDDAGALAFDERLSLYRNRAYLNFDQNQYQASQSDAEKALAMEPAADIALVHLKALANQKEYGIVETNALFLLNSSLGGPAACYSAKSAEAAFATKHEPRTVISAGKSAAAERDGHLRIDLSPNEQAQVHLIIGRCCYQQKRYEAAISNLTAALGEDKSLAEAHYLRGLAYHALGKSGEAMTNYQESLLLATNPPAGFWGDLGQAQGAQKDYKNGTFSLEKALAWHSVDVGMLANQGYQFMKWNHNREAQESFRRAIDLYADLVPRVPTNETSSYRNGQTVAKEEYTKLDKMFGIQGYLSQNTYDLPTESAISSVQGALPSQYGLELTLRPPMLGLRDEKTLEAFGDFLGNFKKNSWSPDRDSYQGMAGLRYKPLAKVNFNTSFARLMRIGDNSENNWLWRNMASWECGGKPEPDKSVKSNVRLFGDAGYYLEERTRWYAYLDGRAGPAIKLNRNALLTVPQAMGILRGESNDSTDLGSYGLMGLGGTLRLFEPERRYTVYRMYVDIFIYYTVGQFISTPEGFSRPGFDGFMFGVNLVK